MSDMTVIELITKLQVLITNDPKVANMTVDSDGCDCIEAAVDAFVHRGWGYVGDDYVASDRLLISRTERRSSLTVDSASKKKPPAVEPACGAPDAIISVNDIEEA